MKEIQLTRGYVAIVDDEDYEEVMRHKWYVSHGCAARMVAGAKPRRQVFMHRQIMGFPEGLEVDHINHDTLDNRRSVNLRACTHAQNLANIQKHAKSSSRFKGVSWNKGICKWEAYIKHRGRKRVLGYFLDELNAARAYNAAAREDFKEYACPNEIPEVPS